MFDTERLRQLEEGYDRRIAAATLEIAQILLREARALGELFLGQALFEPDPSDVRSNQFPHVHAESLDRYAL